LSHEPTRQSISRARRCALALVASLVACGGGGSGGDGGGTPGDVAVALQQVVAGIAFPLDLTAPTSDLSRLFIAEKGGRIRIVRNGALLATPFLDLSALVSNGQEQGLLGIAFHPSYGSNGRFYVDYTDRAGNTQVVEYTVSGDADVASPTSARTILSVAQPFANHNGGGLAFGPEGFLYISLGDGGGAGDPRGNGQDLSDLLGSILRINVDSGSPYSIPSSNPFVATPGARGELWNFGLRNPFRFSFDRSTGELFIGDVGQDAREEIDVAPAGQGGQNYGWNIMEGSACFNASSCNQSGLTLPVLDYERSGGNCSVIGGFVYRGSAIPALRGTYFYGDFCSGLVRSFRFQGGGAADQRQWPTLAPGGMITSFGQDAAGELYVVTDSAVFRIVPG
jgi:hypothetical protein